MKVKWLNSMFHFNGTTRVKIYWETNASGTFSRGTRSYLDRFCFGCETTEVFKVDDRDSRNYLKFSGLEGVGEPSKRVSLGIVRNAHCVYACRFASGVYWSSRSADRAAGRENRRRRTCKNPCKDRCHVSWMLGFFSRPPRKRPCCKTPPAHLALWRKLHPEIAVVNFALTDSEIPFPHTGCLFLAPRISRFPIYRTNAWERAKRFLSSPSVFFK